MDGCRSGRPCCVYPPCVAGPQRRRPLRLREHTKRSIEQVTRAAVPEPDVMSDSAYTEPVSPSPVDVHREDAQTPAHATAAASGRAGARGLSVVRAPSDTGPGGRSAPPDTEIAGGSRNRGHAPHLPPQAARPVQRDRTRARPAHAGSAARAPVGRRLRALGQATAAGVRRHASPPAARAARSAHEAKRGRPRSPPSAATRLRRQIFPSRPIW